MMFSMSSSASGEDGQTIMYIYIYGKNPKMVSEIIQVPHIF